MRKKTIKKSISKYLLIYFPRYMYTLCHKGYPILHSCDIVTKEGQPRYGHVFVMNSTFLTIYYQLNRVLCHPVQHKQEHWITNKNQIKFFYFNVDAGDVIIKSFSARLTKACTCIPSYDVYTGGEMHKYPLLPPFSVTLTCESDLNIRTQIT